MQILLFALNTNSYIFLLQPIKLQERLGVKCSVHIQKSEFIGQFLKIPTL